MKNWMMRIGLSLIWLAAGTLGKDILNWMEDAEKHGLSGKAAFEYVWRKTKTRYSDIGDWLLNLLIEVVVGKKIDLEGRLYQKLRWPDKLKLNL